MKKSLTGVLAAVTAAASVVAIGAPANADPYRYRRHDNNNNNTAAAAVVGGIVGLALGAAIAGSSKDRRASDGYYNNGYYDNGYYRQGYYGDRYGQGGYGYRDNGYYRGYNGYGAYSNGYGYDRGPRVCVTRQPAYDPYTGRRAMVERRYAC